MSRQTAVPNKFLESIIATVAETEVARRRNGEDAGRVISFLGIFADMMGGLSKPAVSQWIAMGGVPRKHAARLREVVDAARLDLAEDRFERLLMPPLADPPRGENKSLQAILTTIRNSGIPLRKLADQMGMSYWQIYRCEMKRGGLPPEKLADFAKALRHFGVTAPANTIADCARPFQRPDRQPCRQPVSRNMDAAATITRTAA